MSTTTKFTEGPWDVEDDVHTPCVTATDAEGNDWIICDLGLPCDLVGLNPENLSSKLLDERAANARLIAAAPMLYEALEGMTRAFSPSPREDTEGWREEHEAFQAATATLAKVEAPRG